MIAVEVRAEQIRTLYRQSAAILVANVVILLVVCAVLWPAASHALLLGWLGGMVALSAVRFSLWLRYQRKQPGPDATGTWGNRFTWGSAAAGLVWGLGGFLFFSQRGALSELLVTFAIGGLCAAAAATLSCHLPAFLAFLVPALSALVLRALSYDDPLHHAIGIMLSLYGLGLYFVAVVNHRSLREAFKLRFENDALIAQLSLAQTRLEETNRTLEQRVEQRTEALKRQADALRDAQRMEALGRLAGGIAHDFNNLLTVVLANLGQLTQERERPEAERVALLEMHDAATRGADLIKQLLMFSRRQRTAPEVLDLNQTVSTMERLLARLIGEHLTLTVVLDDQPLLVCVDPTQIEQVVINLVTNARDAMTSGGQLTIETSTEQVRKEIDGVSPGDYVVLSVSDTGEGIDSATRLRIFEPFFTTKEVGRGTGLGLATVYGIVEQSGGQIRVESERHRGSCFKVYLPVAEAPPLGEPLPHETGPITTRPVTVLLVEDEATVRAVIQRILRSIGHRVLVADSAERALKLASEHPGPIELLLTDVVMAGSGGPELARRLCALRPGLRVLFISGYSRHHVIPESKPAQGIGFLPKPFTYEALVQHVSALLATPGGAGSDTRELG